MMYEVCNILGIITKNNWNHVTHRSRKIFWFFFLWLRLKYALGLIQKNFLSPPPSLFPSLPQNHIYNFIMADSEVYDGAVGIDLGTFLLY